MSAIKRCSCGGEAVMETRHYCDMADTKIQCNKCGFAIGVRDGFDETSVANAIEYWNKMIALREGSDSDEEH